VDVANVPASEEKGASLGKESKRGLEPDPLFLGRTGELERTRKREQGEGEERSHAAARGEPKRRQK